MSHQFLKDIKPLNTGGICRDKCKKGAVKTTKRNELWTLPYRLQLLLFLDQELQHQIDICQVQVLLVRAQRVLEHLPPGPVLGFRDSGHLQALPK